MTEKIEELVRPVTGRHNTFIVEIEIKTVQGKRSIDIFIDNDDGVTTELCSEISREVSRVFDGVDLFQKGYILVVSSPGIDRPLKYFRQYKKNIGRKMSIGIKTNGGTEVLKCVLLSTGDDEITVRPESGAERKILFTAILKAHVEAVW